MRRIAAGVDVEAIVRCARSPHVPSWRLEPAGLNARWRTERRDREGYSEKSVQ